MRKIRENAQTANLSRNLSWIDVGLPAVSDSFEWEKFRNFRKNRNKTKVEKWPK
jgi:hypothetical protein